MNWLKNFVRPKLRKLVGGQKEIPENLWHKCTACDQMIFHRDLEKNHHVCQHCGHHMRIGTEARLKLLFDDEKYELVALDQPLADPLKFRDRKKYSERMKEAQTKTGRDDALVVAAGDIGRIASVVAVLNFSFMGGSMGMAVGDGLLKAARRAVADKAPLIVISSSGGARMQEGILSLMQMARTTIAVEEVKEANLPYIVILTDPTTGGVSASFAMLGDITVAEPGCTIGFAGQRVIEQTIRETLPEGFQTAEYLLDHGMIDMVVHRHEMRSTLVRVLAILTKRTNGSGDVEPGAGQALAIEKVEAEILPPVPTGESEEVPVHVERDPNQT